MIHTRNDSRTVPFVSVPLLALAIIMVSTVAVAEEDAPDSGALAARPRQEEPAYRLDPVIVTAERLPISLARLPYDVSVVTAERLDAVRPLALADALRDVAVVDVTRSGSVGKLTDIRLRGGDPRHALVLYDGVPLNGPWLGSFDFADLGGSGLGQIEILGGPASSLYGSGAVGGVIQVLPLSPAARPVGRAFVEAGRDRTLRQGLVWAGRAGPTGISAAASRLTSDGIVGRDRYRGHSGYVRLERSVDGADLRVGVLDVYGRKELPYDFAYDGTDARFHQTRDPDNDESDRLRVVSGWAGVDVSEGVRLEGEASTLTGRIENRNGPGGSSGDYLQADLQSRRTLLGGRARCRLSDVGYALAGVEWRREGAELVSDYTGDVSRVDESVDARAIYGQGHGEVGKRLLLDAGIRLEDDRKYGPHGVPRAALGVLIPEAGLKLRAGFGRAFASPTLTDRYYPFYGNPSLRAERSRTCEIGADGRWLGGRLEGHATWHWTRFKELIQAFAFQATNIGRARIDGGEIRVRYAPTSRIALFGWTAHLRAARDETTGAPLPKRPRLRHGASIEVQSEAWGRMTATWRWDDSVVDPFTFVDAAGRLLDGDTPGYATLDLGAVVEMPRWRPLAVRLGLENVFDRAYSEVKGFPARGRAVSAGLELRPW